MKNIFKIILVILIIVILVGVGIAFAGIRYYKNGGSSLSVFNYADSSSYGVGEATVRDRVKSISVNWFNGDVDVVEYDGKNVVLEEEVVQGAMDDDLRLRWKNDGGRLMVQYAKAGKKYDLKNFQKKLTVKVPSSISLDEVQIDVVSSDATVRLEEIRELEWDSVNGNLSAEFKSLDEADMDTVNGNVSLTVTSIAPSRIEFDCVNGDLTISIPKDSSFTLTRESINGGFSSDFPVKVEGKDRYIAGDGKNRYKTESVNGNVSVKAI